MTPSPTLRPFAQVPPGAPSWPHAPPKGVRTRQWLPSPPKSPHGSFGKLENGTRISNHGHSQRIHVWYIYLHVANVGKYTIHGSSGIESGTNLEKRTVTNSSPKKGDYRISIGKDHLNQASNFQGDMLTCSFWGVAFFCRLLGCKYQIS